MVEDGLEHEAGDIGDDLLPEHRGGAAIRDARPLRAQAVLGQHLEVVAHAVGEALEQGPEHVPAAVVRPKTGEAPRASGSLTGVFSPSR